MNLKTNLFAILAIFCVILSACAVSAADGADCSDVYLDGSHDGHDGEIIPPDYAHNEAGQAAGGDDLDSEAVHNSMVLPPDYAHNEAAMANVTGNATKATGHAAGENFTAVAGNATGNATNATAAHSLLATGNPILILLGVGAVIGGTCVLRRK